MDPVDFSALFTWSQACCIQLYVLGLTAKKLPNMYKAESHAFQEMIYNMQ